MVSISKPGLSIPCPTWVLPGSFGGTGGLGGSGCSQYWNWKNVIPPFERCHWFLSPKILTAQRLAVALVPIERERPNERRVANDDLGRERGAAAVEERQVVGTSSRVRITVNRVTVVDVRQAAPRVRRVIRRVLLERERPVREVHPASAEAAIGVPDAEDGPVHGIIVRVLRHSRPETEASRCR